MDATDGRHGRRGAKRAKAVRGRSYHIERVVVAKVYFVVGLLKIYNNNCRFS